MSDFAELQSLFDLVDRFYLPLRERAQDAAGAPVWTQTLREDSERKDRFQSSERFLQVLWNEQRLSAPLKLVDGRGLEVLSPGIWNVAAGPDFRDAVIRLDGRTVSGDVEVHLTPGSWYSHGHASDPLYAHVVLHVVWQGAAPDASPPCFELARFLDRPWRTLLAELDAEIYPYARQVPAGGCAVTWALAADARVLRLLRVAGLARFEDKSLRLRRAGIARGFDQALYEALFEALGYRANRAPFRRVARALPLTCLRRFRTAVACEAAFFGSAGLLPDTSTKPISPEWTGRVRELWDEWWRLGLPTLELCWNRAGTRPLNSPERRLAAGAALLHRWAFAPERRLVGLAEQSPEPRALLRNLRRMLAAEEGGWATHQDFTTRLKRPARLLGEARQHDILVNVILPFLNAVGQQDGRRALVDLARAAYLLVPRLQGNRRLAEAIQRFLVPPSRAETLLKGACAQQGMLEIYQSFCLALHHDCKNCPFVAEGPVEDVPHEQ